MMAHAGKTNEKGDYEVGYGKPPKHTRFQPGHSGNSKGRPKGALDLATELREELSQRLSVTENGKTVRITKLRLIVKALFAKAAKGDPRSADVLIRLIQSTASPDDAREDELSPEDQAILDRFVRRADETEEGDDD